MPLLLRTRQAFGQFRLLQLWRRRDKARRPQRDMPALQRPADHLAMMRTLLLAAAAMAAFALPAHAVERGQCLPTDEMVAVLRDEGQRAVVTGEAVMVGTAELAAPLPITYSMNPSGSRGYELSTQRRAGVEVLCVTEVLTDVRLVDPGNREVSAFYLPGGVSDEAARRIGQDEGIPNARGFNFTLDFAANSGFYTVFQARLAGSSGETLAVLNLPRTNESLVYRGDRRGVSTMAYVLRRSGFTPYAREVLGI